MLEVVFFAYTRNNCMRGECEHGCVPLVFVFEGVAVWEKLDVCACRSSFTGRWFNAGSSSCRDHGLLQESLQQQVSLLEAASKRSDERWEEIVSSHKSSAESVASRQRQQYESEVQHLQADIRSLNARLTAAQDSAQSSKDGNVASDPQALVWAHGFVSMQCRRLSRHSIASIALRFMSPSVLKFIIG